MNGLHTQNPHLSPLLCLQPLSPLWPFARFDPFAHRASVVRFSGGQLGFLIANSTRRHTNSVTMCSRVHISWPASNATFNRQTSATRVMATPMQNDITVNELLCESGVYALIWKSYIIAYVLISQRHFMPQLSLLMNMVHLSHTASTMQFKNVKNFRTISIGLRFYDIFTTRVQQTQALRFSRIERFAVSATEN